MILDKLAAGETVEQLLEAHPRLTREGVQAAFAFAAATLRSDIDYAVKNDVTRYPLRSKPIRYSDPFDGVAEDDWQKM